MKKLLLILALLLSNVANAATTINTFMGAWATGTSYSSGNVVTYNNATYLSLINSNKGKIPSTSATSWQLIGLDAAPAGPAGPQGPAGATGATGPAGPQGPGYVAKAGDACTLKNSNIINTGVLTAYTLAAAPVTGQTSFLVCQDPNVWDFVQDAAVSIGTSPQFRNWTLMGGPTIMTGPPSILNGLPTPSAFVPSTFLPFTTYVNSSDISGIAGTAPVVSLVSITPAWTFGVTTTQGVGIGGTETPRPTLAYNGSEEKTGVIFNSGSAATVVRWISPFTGTIMLEGNIYGSWGYFGFYHNSTLIVDVPMILAGPSVSFPHTFSVNTGDAIYYIQDGQAGIGYLKMKITRLN